MARPADAPAGGWTLVIDGPAPGWRNMAVDQALLDAAEASGGAWLRLYRWEPHCLSFGRHEPAARRYHRAKIRALGLDCVRRPTGGRAVWHAEELTYAVAAPVAVFGSLPRAYQTIHQLLAGVIAALGLDARLAPAPARTTGLEGGACFARPAGGEVMVEGWKVVGSAQLRQGEAFLQHGSILLAGTQEPVAAVSAGDVPPGGERALARLLGREVAAGEMAAHIAAAARASWTGKWRDGPLPEALDAAADRHAARFRDDAWTWRR